MVRTEATKMIRAFKLEMHSNTEVWEVRRRQAPHGAMDVVLPFLIDWWCLSFPLMIRGGGKPRTAVLMCSCPSWVSF